MIKRLFSVSFILLLCCAAYAKLEMSSIFGDHMVLQRGIELTVWGKADPGNKLSVSFAGQNHSTRVGEDGKWELKLDPLAASFEAREFKVVSGHESLTFKDVLVGEVWLCSGQSNMDYKVLNSDHGSVEALAANFPGIRMMIVPFVGNQEKQHDIDAEWKVCNPETAGEFTAVGYFFGRQLHQVLNVPVGLIENAWGGSKPEAWTPRELLENDDRFKALMERTVQEERDCLEKTHKERLAEYKKIEAAALSEGRHFFKMKPKDNYMTAQWRPGNLYNGMISPMMRFGIRGAIWYQGESSIPWAYEYRDIFPAMISSWREAWGQGDFPFYWVGLPAFMPRNLTVDQDSHWAELRESQASALVLPNTGQAVCYDLGEADDLHPSDKFPMAMRLARIALARDYGYDIAYKSPDLDAVAYEGNKVRLSFNGFHEGEILCPHNTFEVKGFQLAGKDRVWHRASAAFPKKTGGKTITLECSEVPKPVAVRYAWDSVPDANVRTSSQLPLAPFRTDDWPLITQP